MPLSLKFDHAVILVNDLNAAIEDYRKLGFNPFFGGQHAGGKTHNALIVFADDSYLELLAPTSPELLQQVDQTDHTSFLYMFAHGEGLGGYALQSDTLQTQIESMVKEGLNVKMRPAGGRARPDGQQLRWQSAMIGDSMIPFFIQDDTPRALRVPNDPDKITQPNGVQGVAGVTVAVPHLDTGITLYRTITGEEPQTEATNSVLFSLGGFTIRVFENKDLDNRVGKLAALQFRAVKPQSLDKKLTHGAEIVLVS